MDAGEFAEAGPCEGWQVLSIGVELPTAGLPWESAMKSGILSLLERGNHRGVEQDLAERLIQECVDTDALAQMYEGWTPWI